MTTTRGRDYRRKRARILRDSNVCAICGDPIDTTLKWPDPYSASVDHKTPINRGGTNHPANLQAAHLRCNRSKSDNDHAPIVRRSGSLG